MNIVLEPDLEKFIQDKVESKFYSSADEVVCKALRLLLQFETYEAKLSSLRKDIEDGLNSGDSVPLDMDEIKRLARSHNNR